MYKSPVNKDYPKTAPKFDYDEPGNPWDHVDKVDYLKCNEWVTVVDWCYSPHRIRQGRVVKVFAGKDYVHEYTDPDGRSEGHWKENPWVEVRFGPKNVERINYSGYSPLQAIYRYDKSIQEEHEAEMNRIHRDYMADLSIRRGLGGGVGVRNR